MLLTNSIIPIIIVIGATVFFLTAVILNGITKTPENIELPEQCGSCPSASCGIKLHNSPKKETLKEFYEKCEENNINEEKN